MLLPGYFSIGEELYIPDYRYKKITDDTSGTEEVVWQPTSGKHLRIMTIIVSVDTAGTVEIKDGTAGTTIGVLEFETRKTMPFTLGAEFTLPVDHVLSVKFTVDAGSGTCHISAFGQEK